MKIVIDHIAGSRRGQRQEFDAVPRIRFGRHPDNDVSFDAHRDLDASSRHAELLQSNGAYLLRDIGSSNGTYVQGQRVNEVTIGFGSPQVIEFGNGGPRVRIFIGDPASVPALPAIDPNAPPPTVASRGGAPGRRTVAMMLRAAAEDASHQHGLARPTMFMRSLFDQAVHKSTRKFKIAMIATGATAAVLIAGLVIWNARTQNALERQRQEEAERARQRDREQAIQMAEMQRIQTEGPGTMIADRYGKAIYLFVVRRPDGEANGFCTGFAVGKRHLGTNAHCVVEARRLAANGFEIFVYRNGGGVEPIKVKDMVKHPSYRGGLTEDVGLVEVERDLEVEVKLATLEDLRGVRKGANVFTLGFPGRLAKRIDQTESPDATIVNGIIGRITTFRGGLGAWEEELLVQHNLLTSPGTSGSPIFDGFGRVIAVNAGSYTESRTDILVDPVTGEQKQINRSVLTPGANFGIRVDALIDLMRDKNLEIPHAQGGNE